MVSIHKQKVPSYLTSFSQAQLDVILGEAPIKQVVAGAGSGKTRTVIGLLEYRLREKLDQPERILVLSFSRKAVEELRSRIPEKLGCRVEISTFHAFCLHSLPSIYPRALENITILTDEKKERFFYDFLHQSGYWNEIGGVPFSLIWEQPLAFAETFPKLYEDIQSALQKHKLKNKIFEFEDLIEWMLRSLRKKTKRSLHLANQYDLIIVDEFQDTDPRQLEFLKWMNAPRKMVVGDDWQAIYGFRGASLNSFLDFRRIFSAQQIWLCDNYRSLGNIVHFGAHIIKASKKQIAKKVHAIRGAGPGLPVLRLTINEDAFPQTLACFLNKQMNTDYQILVRTNRQRSFWLGMGIEEKRVMTIHKSKGLEFPVVFLDLCFGWSNTSTKTKKNAWLPFKNKKYDEWDEEIRILYVGASRAMNLLVFLHLPLEVAAKKETYYCEKLIFPHARPCSLSELFHWLAKEESCHT